MLYEVITIEPALEEQNGSEQGLTEKVHVDHSGQIESLRRSAGSYVEYAARYVVV